MGRRVGYSVSHEQMRVLTNMAEATGVLSRTAPCIVVRGRLYDSPPRSLGSRRSLSASPNMLKQ